MISRQILSCATALLFVFCSFATAQGPAPVEPPNPTGTYNMVEVKGEITNLRHEFYPDGTWLMWDDITGESVGWGTWEQDETGAVNYVNNSPDGGGGQTGTYEWDGTGWNRTQASHPDAPPLRLVPSA